MSSGDQLSPDYDELHRLRRALGRVTVDMVALEAGATDIDIILTEPSLDPATSFKTKTKALDVVFRSLALMSDQIMANDIKICNYINGLVDSQKVTDKRKINLTIIRPDKVLLQNPLDFTQKTLRSMWSQGYLDARKVLDS